MYLGEYIEAERDRMGLTRAALAATVGYHANSIYEIERMGQDVPRAKLVAILQALQVQELHWPTVMAMPVGRVAAYKDAAAESER